MKLHTFITKWSLKTLLLVQLAIALGLWSVASYYWRDYETPELLRKAGAIPKHASAFYVSRGGDIGIMGRSVKDVESEEIHLAASDVAGVFVKDKNWNKQVVFRLLDWLPNLQFLSLEHREIGDDDARFLATLDVPMLNISYNPISDDGLMALTANKSLRQLWVYKTNTTEEGIQRFRQLRPDVLLYDPL
ncbi:hypothetical protein [Bremerella cremea]|uniref:hypothetical protein n=1 Tax=Bremerella cremea TaxID=1031537 RepID=UPI0031E7FCA3